MSGEITTAPERKKFNTINSVTVWAVRQIFPLIFKEAYIRTVKNDKDKTFDTFLHKDKLNKEIKKTVEEAKKYLGRGYRFFEDETNQL